MKDAYFSYQGNEMYLVLKSMKDLIQLQPQMANELEPYIIMLETRIEGIYSENLNQEVQQNVIDKKHESLNLP